MTDIVERLHAVALDDPYGDAEEAIVEIGRLREELADVRADAELLRAEIQRLRADMQEITDLCKSSPADPFLADNMDRIARRALEPNP